MVCKIKYDADADVMSIFVSEKGRLAHAEEMEDVVVHVDENGKPLFIEVLHASKLMPAMAKAFSQKETVKVSH